MRPAAKNARGSRFLIVGVALLTAVLGAVLVDSVHAGDPDGLATGPWATHIRAVDAALGQGAISAAVMAWHDAYGAALGSRRWEGMVAVGDVALRIGQASGSRKASEAQARRVYLTALFRARNQGSLDGVLRVGEAFAALGDRQVAEQALVIATRLAARSNDREALGRVRAFQERWIAASSFAEDSGVVAYP